MQCCSTSTHVLAFDIDACRSAPRPFRTVAPHSAQRSPRIACDRHQYQQWCGGEGTGQRHAGTRRQLRAQNSEATQQLPVGVRAIVRCPPAVLGSSELRSSVLSSVDRLLVGVRAPRGCQGSSSVSAGGWGRGQGEAVCVRVYMQTHPFLVSRMCKKPWYKTCAGLPETSNSCVQRCTLSLGPVPLNLLMPRRSCHTLSLMSPCPALPDTIWFPSCVLLPFQPAPNPAFTVHLDLWGGKRLNMRERKVDRQLHQLLMNTTAKVDLAVGVQPKGRAAVHQASHSSLLSP